TGRDLPGEPHQPWLVNARRMQSGGEQRRPAAQSLGLVDARAHWSARRRDRQLARVYRNRVEIGDAPDAAVDIRGAKDAREPVKVRACDHEPADDERDREQQRRETTTTHGLHVTVWSGRRDRPEYPIDLTH